MRKILIFFVAVLVAACSFQTKHRGFIFPENLDGEVAKIKTTAQLESAFGSPMVKTIYGRDVWIYYGADENYHGPFPTSYDNRTALLAWVDGGRVTKIQVLRDDDLPTVKMADFETEIPAAIELNAIQELFNNVGRFTPAGLGQ